MVDAVLADGERREDESDGAGDRVEDGVHEPVPQLGQQVSRDREQLAERNDQEHVDRSEKSEEDGEEDGERKGEQRDETVDKESDSGEHAVVDAPRKVPRVRRVGFSEDVVEGELDVLVDSVRVAVDEVDADGHLIVLLGVLSFSRALLPPALLLLLLSLRSFHSSFHVDGSGVGLLLSPREPVLLGLRLSWSFRGGWGFWSRLSGGFSQWDLLLGLDRLFGRHVTGKRHV